MAAREGEQIGWAQVSGGETHPLPGQTIEIGREMIFAAVAPKVVDAEIVGENEDNIGRSGQENRLKTQAR